MRAPIVALALSVALAGPPPRAQDLALPAFEVASIKPRTGEPVLQTASSPDSYTHPDATVVDLLAFAHDLQDFQVLGGPDWLRATRYVVSAKAATVPTATGMRQMVRRLLAERFGVRTHDEVREMPVYKLMMARSDGRLGARMTPSSVDCPAMIEARAADAATDAAAPCRWRIGFMASSALMTLDGAPLPRLARLLQPMVGRIVLDQTGRTGTFDLQLEFAPEQTALDLRLAPRTPAAPGLPQSGRDGLSLFTALEEQLGLRLEAGRDQVPVIVVDEARSPTPD